MHAVSEGVDSAEQAKTLRSFRGDQMQGDLFSKPIPMDELPRALRRVGKPRVLPTLSS
jgi:EAL domain-containing protein (putative c-di-GMP-specific phosphodiesterase class I)